MLKYLDLNQQSYTSSGYSIVPIQFDDRFEILKWRNEQIYHLRQNKIITEEEQDKYFGEVVEKLFEQRQPNQFLFSYLHDDKCIGYGGIVHINWEDKHGEISFIMDTSLEKDYFELHWINFLNLIEQIAFKELDLHKISTYAYDLRPRLYSALDQACFYKEAVLREHIYFQNKFVDVVIHSKINKS